MHWTPSRSYHVENYKLTLHFSQSRAEVFGDELVTMRPFEPGFDRFCIDSTELTIDSVTLVTAAGTPAALPYTTDDHCLWIGLGHPYGPSDSLNIRIVYHGHPRIGLFFVNPGRNDPDAPREIYTRGEPEFNHYWFPCWDHPNDMSTSETITTVPDGQVVVSNGKLVSVKRAADAVTMDVPCRDAGEFVGVVQMAKTAAAIAIEPWQPDQSDSRRNPMIRVRVEIGVNEHVTRGRADSSRITRLLERTADDNRCVSAQMPMARPGDVVAEAFEPGYDAPEHQARRSRVAAARRTRPVTSSRRAPASGRRGGRTVSLPRPMICSASLIDCTRSWPASRCRSGMNQR